MVIELEVVIEIPRGSFLKRGSTGHIDFVSPLPCPSVSAPSAAPSIPCMPATPKPPKLPTPTPSLTLCPSLPAVSVPGLSAVPDWLLALLFGGAA